MRWFLILMLCVFTQTIYSQQYLNGKIIDNRGEQLAFVNILPDGDTYQGLCTDIDGRFQLKNPSNYSELHLSYIGYQDTIVSIVNVDLSKEIILQMQTSSFKIQEAVVIAGENPAHRIIRAVVRNRTKNNPDKLAQYSCQTYNKLVAEIKPNKEEYEARNNQPNKKKNWFNRRQDTLYQIYSSFSQERKMMVMETVTDIDFLASNNYNEHVISNKISGFKEPSFVALAKDAQPFHFYDAQPIILGDTYLSPISINSENFYFFDWRDTLFQGLDTIFVISFQPKKGKTFEALKGVLYIHSHHYAIQNVIAEPARAANTQIRIEQKYQFLKENDQWFPEQLNFEWLMPKYPLPVAGLGIQGKSYISKVHFDKALAKKQFNSFKYTIDEDAHVQSDSTWDAQRIEDLELREQNTYIWWDTMPRLQKVEKRMKIAESFISGVYKMGKLDLDTPRLLDLNEYEGTRLGIGLHTNQDWSKWFRIGGYIGYGFQDKAWKYGGDVQFRIDKRSNLRLELGLINDLSAPGYIQLPALYRQNRIFDSGLYDTFMDDYLEVYAQLSARIFKNADVYLRFSQNSRTPNYDYAFGSGDVLSAGSYDFTEIQASCRYAFGEEYIPIMGQTFASPTRFPILQLSYTKGFDSILGGEFDFQILSLGITQSVPLRRLGTLSYKIQASRTIGDLPISRLILDNGVGATFSLLNIDEVFQTMETNEALYDQIVRLFFKHQFMPITRKVTWTQPRPSVVFNMSWGDLDRPDLHHDFEFNTFRSPYLETGLILDNIVRFNYLNVAYFGLGWATYMRVGSNAYDNLAENFAHRLTLDFSF